MLLGKLVFSLYFHQVLRGYVEVIGQFSECLHPLNSGKWRTMVLCLCHIKSNMSVFYVTPVSIRTSVKIILRDLQTPVTIINTQGLVGIYRI